ncbi:MAG: DUF2784 family protein [Deltaproteobacteria bacterium]|nr:DUF2784 family protein [Deltaproteobacteria bacterium]MBW2661312.1 DUF2784 family protein [Deltaproteobacteria bacterium]
MAFILQQILVSSRCNLVDTFRICRILVMGIVLCESLIGMICPLTEWENYFRVRGGKIRYMKQALCRNGFTKSYFLISVN